MDEEKGIQEQNQGEKEQGINEAAQGAKDGASLAKNAASGNYLGAAKDTVNLLKNKKVRRMMILQTIMPFIIIFAIVLGAAAIIKGVFDAVGDVVTKLLTTRGEYYSVDYENGGIIAITDEALDKMIEEIESLGISLDSLNLMGDLVDYNDPEVEEKNKEALRKYLRQFYEAQAVTQTLYTNPTWPEKAIGKTYGTVYLQRTKDGDTNLDNIEKLEYIPYERMQEKKENQDRDINRYFSIDEDEKLVVANYTQTIIKENGRETKNETAISLSNIDYKSVISPYTTYMDFFIYLTVITQNPEFASAVADLVKQSDIKITFIDKKSTNVTTDVHTYTLNTKEGSETKSEDKTDTIETTIISTMANPVVSYAKTWFSEQTIGYTKKTTPITEEPYNTEIVNESEPEDSTEETVIWMTNSKHTITTTGNISQYEESIRGDVVDKTGEKGDGKESFVGLIDVEFKIPNSNKKDTAGGNLKSGAELLFELLQKDPNTQNLEDIMRYILYKYTGKNYGVTEFDFSIFDAKEFRTVGSGSSRISEILRSYENDALRKYMNGDNLNYSSVEEFVTQDKTQYKLYYTSHDGCLNFSYGIMVRNAGGTINNAGYFTDEGIDLQSLINKYDNGQDVYVDVEIIDRIYNKIINDRKKIIREFFDDRGISLKQNELDALINVSYQYGNCGQYIDGNENIANLYSNYYDKGNINEFKNKAQASTGSGGRAFIFDDSSTRKQRNWKLFSEGKYILNDGTELTNQGSEIIEFALQFEGENHSRFTGYNPNNGVNDIWYGADWCAMFVSYCYNECGLIPDIISYPYASCSLIGNLYDSGNSRVRIVGNLGKFKGAKKDNYVPSPGDIIFFNWGNATISSHTGIVVSCDGINVYTIEGNTGYSSTNPYWKGSRVEKKKYPINSASIVGYISINDD